jgi:hypothetical protein
MPYYDAALSRSCSWKASVTLLPPLHISVFNNVKDGELQKGM